MNRLRIVPLDLFATSELPGYESITMNPHTGGLLRRVAMIWIVYVLALAAVDYNFVLTRPGVPSLSLAYYSLHGSLALIMLGATRSEWGTAWRGLSTVNDRLHGDNTGAAAANYLSRT